MIKRTLALTNLLLAGIFLSATQAGVVDLTGNNNSGTINNGIFSFTNQQPTGTGVIDPFLRVQNSPSEQGYNTSGGTPFDDKAGPWTHNIQLSDLRNSIQTINGAQYFTLLLDVNEPGSRSLISLDSLSFYTSSIGSQTTTNINQLGVLRWNLDGAGNSYVLLDAARNHGSGSGDMYAYIPVSAFAGASDSDYVYMFTRFGDQMAADGTSSGGFEEWAIINNIAAVPEMNALFPILGLLGTMIATHYFRRQRMARVSVCNNSPR
jgi:hypothetical protein